MLETNVDNMFTFIFFGFILVFMAIAAWKKSKPMFLFTSLLGLAFTKYAWDTYGINENQTLMLGFIWLGTAIYGVFIGR